MGRRMLKIAVCITFLWFLLLSVVPVGSVSVVDNLLGEHVGGFSKVRHSFSKYQVEGNLCDGSLSGKEAGFYGFEKEDRGVEKWFWKSREHFNLTSYLHDLEISGLSFEEMESGMDHILYRGEKYALYPNMGGSKTPVDEDILVESSSTGGPNSVHNINTGEDFSSIQAAIDDPDTRDGDTILVDPGVYVENIRVYKSLTIRSTSGNPEDTIIEAVVSYNPVLDITIDNVTIDGFTIRGTNESGVRVDDAIDCVISNNSVTANLLGISLVKTKNIRVLNNSIFDNRRCGISLLSCSNNIIDNNSLIGNGFGIFLSSCTDNTVRGNTFIRNGLFVENSSHSIVSDNVVNGKPLVYLEDVSGVRVDDAGQVILVNCSDILVENLDLSDVEVGVELWGSHHCEIKSNRITNHRWVGIYLWFSNGNIISDNNITNNGNVINNGGGVVLCFSNNNSLLDNNVFNNMAGVWLHGVGNTISNNRILNSTEDGLILFNGSSNMILDNNITRNQNNGITGFKCSMVLVYGNNIISNQGDGMVFYFSDNVVLSANNITKNHCSGLILSGSNNLINGNDIENNGEDGLFSYASKNYTIANNSVINNQKDGVILCISNNNRVYNNSILNNQRDGLALLDCSSNTISSNTISGNDHGIFLDASENNFLSDNDITNSNNGIYLRDSKINTVFNNSITDNWHGITICFSRNNKISSNKFIRNNYGVELRSSSFLNHVYKCVFSDNRIGVELRNSFLNNVKGCRFSDNRFCGVYSFGSRGNFILYNDFIDNTIHYRGWQGDKNYFYRNYWNGRALQLPIPYIVSVNWKTNGALRLTVNIDWFPRTKPYSSSSDNGLDIINLNDLPATPYREFNLDGYFKGESGIVFTLPEGTVDRSFCFLRKGDILTCCHWYSLFKWRRWM